VREVFRDRPVDGSLVLSKGEGSVVREKQSP
jgi:hypothetical protein